MRRGDKGIRIGLLWHSLRSNNLGVGALTVAHVEIVDAAARRTGCEFELHVIGTGGELFYPPPYRRVRETVVTSSADLLPGSPVWRAIRACDIVLDIGLGDSWADLYGAKRFVFQWLTKEMALWGRRRLVLAPQTVGPFGRAWCARVARHVHGRCEAVYTRDAESLELAHRMGAPGAIESVDVAFRLPYVPRPKRGDGRIQFGLNVSGLLYAGGYDPKAPLVDGGKYRMVVEGIFGALRRRGDVDVVLVPHVMGKVGPDADEGVSHDLAARYGGVTVAPRFGSPSEAKSFISGLDLLAGSRMHATIAAVSSGVPVVPLAYSRKFRGVFASVGYPLVMDVKRDAVDALVAETVGALQRRAELAAASERAQTLAETALASYEQGLSRVLQSAANGAFK